MVSVGEKEVTTGTNRRVIVNSIDDVALETVPEAGPGAGEVRVRSTVVGISDSDLHAACGSHPFIDLPYRPGHEVIGVVERGLLGRQAPRVIDAESHPGQQLPLGLHPVRGDAKPAACLTTSHHHRLDVLAP